MKVPVHRIVGYQKYGEDIFKTGILCRHLDSDKNNFLFHNIAIGNKTDNFNDNPDAVKRKIISAAQAGAKSLRKFNDEEAAVIRKRYADGESIGVIAREKGCAKNTIRYLCLNFTYGR